MRVRESTIHLQTILIFYIILLSFSYCFYDFFCMYSLQIQNYFYYTECWIKSSQSVDEHDNNPQYKDNAHMAGVKTWLGIWYQHKPVKLTNADRCFSVHSISINVNKTISLWKIPLHYVPCRHCLDGALSCLVLMKQPLYEMFPIELIFLVLIATWQRFLYDAAFFFRVEFSDIIFVLQWLFLL